MTKKIAQVLTAAELSAIEIAAVSAAPAPTKLTLEKAPISLEELIKAVTEDMRTAMLVSVEAQFDDRAAYERAVNPSNGTIQDKLKGYRTRMAKPGIAGIMIATKIDEAFLNRSISEGKRFNIYAIDKMNDLLHGLNSGHFKNAINIAVMKSLFKFRAAGMPFTGLAAQACASDKVKVDRAMQQHLVRHTVAAGTAPTQSSSTMNALQVLGVVKNTASVKHPVWVLTETPVTQKLEALIAA